MTRYVATRCPDACGNWLLLDTRLHRVLMTTDNEPDAEAMAAALNGHECRPGVMRVRCNSCHALVAVAS